MSLVQKAVWYIESNLKGDLSLEEIAYAAHTTRFHLARLFQRATGYTVMGYIRARRLSEGAKLLAADPDARILSVALEVGYGSHEAFSRAFKQLFAIYPQAFRKNARSNSVPIVEPITFTDNSLAAVDPARFETLGSIRISGIRERYTWDSPGAIAGQWARFVPLIRDIPNRVGMDSFGVCTGIDDEGGFDYLTGVRTERVGQDSQDFVTVRIPPAEYAVFVHNDHISTIRDTALAIWSDWLPNSDFQVAGSPDFERYPPSFDGNTGLGGVELWVPIERL